ncbi:zinc-binding alcohol dehydrogenase [Cohnella pontilimi]|uniref:Zinc-binding alcohol dehydrogenase n=1 Tax=Cohnella pontilimi TaxID=2564100 RepID=A0A4U0FI44_9BACL|nr:zinc-binding alcohol dehydrogenase [Cohnella pontilimi]TJY44124.1 zinc-binding alcohol dehydrogenase [Cohnella pontilimi]
MNGTDAKLMGRRLVFPEAFQCTFESSEWMPSAVPDDSVLIRNDFSLISPGTELALYTGTHIDIDNLLNTWAKLPFYPGYASVGEVIAIGRSVHQVRAGDQVLALGHHADYDFIPYSEEFILPFPEQLDPRHALFARLAEISSSAILQCARFRPGDVVAVIGMGLIGNLAAQLFALQGARVIAIDLIEQRLNMAKASNITNTICPAQDMDLKEQVKEATGGRLPDIVVEATGTPSLVNVSLNLVRRHGQVILLGSPRGTAEIDIYRHIHSKGVSLIGAHANVKAIDGIPSSAEMWRYALSLIANRQLSVEPLITHELSADEAPGAYDMLLNRKEEALGVILDWRKR